MPVEVAQVVYGAEQPRWLKEVVLAHKEINGSIPQLTAALTVAATENSSFTKALLTAVMVCALSSVIFNITILISSSLCVHLSSNSDLLLIYLII